MSSSHIRTRLLILSDTHGHALLDPARDGDRVLHYGFHRPLPQADVALHCGDLTLRSTPQELETTLDMMREIDAPLKLIIPGNHDSALDPKFWEEQMSSKTRWLSPSEVASVRTIPEQCTSLIRKARQQDPSIHVLINEGTHHFVLHPSRSSCARAARFTIFTSPWTPAYGLWGFQYEQPGRHFGGLIPPLRAPGGFDRSSGRDGEIDVIMTHGPPYGVLDDTRTGEKAGCKTLLKAVSIARPKVHCFGHIHEGAGAELVRWGEDDDDDGAIDRAEVVATAPSGSQQDEVNGGLRPLNLCAGDEGSGDGNTLEFENGKQTLFVNAAIMTVGYKPLQSPWLVHLDLAVADDAYKMKAEETQVRLSS